VQKQEENNDQEESQLQSEQDQTQQQQQKQKQKQSQSLPPHTLMGNLLALQNTQGAFVYSAELAKALGVALSSLDAAMSSLPQLTQVADPDLRRRIWATVLALVYLKSKLANLAEERELIEQKSKKWLAGQGVKDQEPIFAAAEQLLQ